MARLLAVVALPPLVVGQAAPPMTTTNNTMNMTSPGTNSTKPPCVTLPINQVYDLVQRGWVPEPCQAMQMRRRLQGLDPGPPCPEGLPKEFNLRGFPGLSAQADDGTPSDSIIQRMANRVMGLIEHVMGNPALEAMRYIAKDSSVAEMPEFHGVRPQMPPPPPHGFSGIPLPPHGFPGMQPHDLNGMPPHHEHGFPGMHPHPEGMHPHPHGMRPPHSFPEMLPPEFNGMPPHPHEHGSHEMESGHHGHHGFAGMPPHEHHSHEGESGHHGFVGMPWHDHGFPGLPPSFPQQMRRLSGEPPKLDFPWKHPMPKPPQGHDFTGAHPGQLRFPWGPQAQGPNRFPQIFQPQAQSYDAGSSGGIQEMRTDMYM